MARIKEVYEWVLWSGVRLFGPLEKPGGGALASDAEIPRKMRCLDRRCDSVHNVAMYEALLEPVKARLSAAGVQCLGVFGSFARNELRTDSDVDVLVAFEPRHKTFDNLYEVGEALEEVFGRRVDLVTEDSLSPHIGPYILREVQYVDLSR